MKVDIIFLVNHFRKDGEGFFFHFSLALSFYILKEVVTSVQVMQKRLHCIKMRLIISFCIGIFWKDQDFELRRTVEHGSDKRMIRILPSLSFKITNNENFSCVA